MNPATKLSFTNFADKWLQYVMPVITYNKLNTRYGTNDNGIFEGISYYNLPDDIKSEILNSIIPDEHKHYFDVKLMIINKKEVPPHVDSGAMVAINFYLTTCGETITSFYKEIESSSINKTKIDNQTDGYMIDNKNLVNNFSFVAKKDEVWILDVKKPHSVKCELSNEIRIAFNILSRDLSYESVCQKLCINS